LARILIIDDDADVRSALHRVLSSEGHHVEEVQDSDTGIRLHHEHPFDLIITDILMPDKEGISTIIELRQEYPKLKIIAMSGGGDFEPYGYLDIARRVGAERTLPKPFKREDIIEAVSDVLSREENRKEEGPS
jgi:DNA-binding NtrC family response regulator